MGDFDKAPETSAADAAAKEKKKLVMVGVLGAVLVAVLGFTFLKGTPQNASGQSFGSATESPGGEIATGQTPAQALAELDAAKDPTKDLLLGTAELPKDLAAVPRNPFKLSDNMRAQLIKPVIEVPRAQPVKPVQTEIVVTQPKAPTAPDVKLQGIFRQGDKLYASINGQLLTVGMTTGKARVVDIREDQVLLRHADYPGGPITAQSLKKN
jgi:hypothetical protein